MRPGCRLCGETKAATRHWHSRRPRWMVAPRRTRPGHIVWQTTRVTSSWTTPALGARVGSQRRVGHFRHALDKLVPLVLMLRSRTRAYTQRREVAQQVDALARVLVVQHGCARGSRVGVYGSNSPSWLAAMIVRMCCGQCGHNGAGAFSHACTYTYVAQAISACGGVCVPLYDSLGPGAVAHILTHSGMEVVFVQVTASDLAHSCTQSEAHAGN